MNKYSKVGTLLAAGCLFLLPSMVNAREVCSRLVPPPPPKPAGAAAATTTPEVKKKIPLEAWGGGSAGTPLVFVGDSLTHGQGASSRDFSPPELISKALGERKFQAFEKRGLGSTDILSGLDDVAIPADGFGVIWVGRNNTRDPEVIVRDAKAIAEKFGDSHLVVSVLYARFENDKYDKGTFERIKLINSRLKETFGTRYVEVGDTLNCIDYKDDYHLADSGYQKVSREITSALTALGI